MNLFEVKHPVKSSPTSHSTKKFEAKNHWGGSSGFRIVLIAAPSQPSPGQWRLRRSSPVTAACPRRNFTAFRIRNALPSSLRMITTETYRLLRIMPHRATGRQANFLQDSPWRKDKNITVNYFWLCYNRNGRGKMLASEPEPV